MTTERTPAELLEPDELAKNLDDLAALEQYAHGEHDQVKAVEEHIAAIATQLAEEQANSLRLAELVESRVPKEWLAEEQAKVAGLESERAHLVKEVREHIDEHHCDCKNHNAAEDACCDAFFGIAGGVGEFARAALAHDQRVAETAAQKERERLRQIYRDGLSGEMRGFRAGVVYCLLYLTEPDSPERDADTALLEDGE